MNRHVKDHLPTFRTCSHPGCTIRMSKRHNTYDAGLCKHHGGIRRGNATASAFVPPPPEPERPGVRVVDVVRAAYSGSGSESGVMRVSLAKEPWDLAVDKSVDGGKALQINAKKDKLNGPEECFQHPTGPDHARPVRGDRTHG